MPPPAVIGALNPELQAKAAPHACAASTESCARFFARIDRRASAEDAEATCEPLPERWLELIECLREQEGGTYVPYKHNGRSS